MVQQIIFLMLLATAVTYLCLILTIAFNEKTLKKLETPIVIIVFMGIFQIIYPPFKFIDPFRFALSSLSVNGLIVTLSMYILLFLALSKTCFKRFFGNLLFLSKVPTLVVLLLIIVLSCLWSETPGLTLRSSIPPVGLVILAVQLAKRYSWQKLEVVLRWSLTLIAIFSIFTAVFLPFLPADRWGGIVFSSKNLGQLMALNIALWLIQAIQCKKIVSLSTSMVILCFSLLIMTQAKSAWLTTLALLFFILSFSLLRSLKFKQAVPIFILSIPLMIFLGIAVVHGFDFLLHLLGKDPTLTGRTVFWQELLEKVITHPLGYGYNGFWQPFRGNEDPSATMGGSLEIGGYRPPHAHNGFLEVALQLGYVGFFLFVVFFLMSFVNSIWNIQFYKGSEAIFPPLIFIYLIQSNCAETWPLGMIGPNHSWFLFVLVTIKLNLEHNSRGYKRVTSSC